MSVEKTVALVSRYFEEIWNRGNLASEPEFVHPNIVVHAPPFPGLPAGIAGPIQIVSIFRAAMPDLHLTNDVLFGEDDKVVQRWTTVGTHTGSDLFGVRATSRRLTITGINEFRIDGGRIVERWGTIDALGVLLQLGVVSLPGQTAG